MILVENKEKMYEHFSCYETLNIKGVINNTDYSVYVDDLDRPTGLWVKDRYFNFLYAKEQLFVKHFNEFIEEDEFGFAGTNKVCFDYFKDHELIHWKNTCNQYHYAGEKFTGVVALDSLTLEDAEYVNEHYEYNNDNSLDKIKEAIINRPTSCIRVDGVLVSFVLLHNDDSIGYMFTLPEHRGQGYAYQLTKDIVNKTLDSGRLPYIQIVHGNHKSEQLALKAGFIKHGEVEWFGVVKLGDEFKKYLEKYNTLFKCKGHSVSTLCHLKETYQPLEVTVKDTTILYNKDSYKFEMIYDDEIYYIKCDMPEEVLISGLISLMKEDYEMCIINQKIQSSSFKSVD
jgi:RimJ/RimL family protein N-acetyltransferase